MKKTVYLQHKAVKVGIYRCVAHLYMRVRPSVGRSVAVMWKRKRKLESEAAEAAVFYGSGSGKRKMNESGSGSIRKYWKRKR